MIILNALQTFSKLWAKKLMYSPYLFHFKHMGLDVCHLYHGQTTYFVPRDYDCAADAKTQIFSNQRRGVVFFKNSTHFQETDLFIAE